MDDEETTLRLECLRMALQTGETRPDEVVAVARKFYKFAVEQPEEPEFAFR